MARPDEELNPPMNCAPLHDSHSFGKQPAAQQRHESGASGPSLSISRGQQETSRE